MRLNDLPPTTHINDRRITRANAGKFIRNGIREEEGYRPLPGNRLSTGDPAVWHIVNSRQADSVGNLIRRMNQSDTIPHASPDPHEPNMRTR